MDLCPAATVMESPGPNAKPAGGHTPTLEACTPLHSHSQPRPGCVAMTWNLESRVGYNLLQRYLSNLIATLRLQKEWLTTQEGNVLSSNLKAFADE